jgi:hypothetical protein
VIPLCAPYFLDNGTFIKDVIAMHDTYIFILKMDDISSFQRPVLRHKGDTILQNEVM